MTKTNNDLTVRVCPYCGGTAELIDSAEVYGKSYGWMYICRPCDAYVGCHRNTKIPLGFLADKDLREWKKKAHAAFDPLWKPKRGRRGQMYSWLADKLGIDKRACHIGMFDIELCKRTVEICLMEGKK